jgi:hypothetical protein
MKPDEKTLVRRRQAQDKIRSHWTPEKRRAESEKAKERWKARKAKIKP